MTKPKLDHKCRTMWDDGISEYQWETWRYGLTPLSCREKLRPRHWQRKLYGYFSDEFDLARIPEDRALIERVITEMMEGSRSWCNPEMFDDAGGRAALRKAFDTILAAQDSTPLDGAGMVSQPVDIVARTAELAREVLQS